MSDIFRFLKEHFSIRVLIISLGLSLCLYTFFVSIYFSSIIDKLSHPFTEMVKMIEINKQKIIMQSLLAESEVNRPNLVNKYTDENQSVYVYAKNGIETLNEHELTMRSVMKITQKFTPIAFNNESVYVLYRSYEAPVYLSSSEILDFPEETYDIMNTEGRCAIIMVCAKYAGEVQLSDRVLISPFYQDVITKKMTITMSSPIYGPDGKIILGDLNADFHVDDYFSDEFSMSSELQGEFKRNIISDKNIMSDGFNYSTSYIADGNTIFIFKLAYSRLFGQNLWVLIFTWLLTYFAFNKWYEVKKKKKELIKTQEDVIRDPLTGLYNRNIFETEFFLEQIRNVAGSIIAIDGNKIKRINDTYGHSVGDLAIQFIADKMKESFRTSDFLIRMGGDEFIVILPGCSFVNAQMLAKKLEAVFYEQRFSNQALSVSIAWGVIYSEADECFEDAILRADEVLYEQKNSRNDDE